MRNLTILTLMGGRWHSLDPFLHGLLNLECDRKDVALLWFSNADISFVNVLHRIKPGIEKEGFQVQIVHDDSLAPSENVFSEGGPRVDIHVNTITALYNAAWQYVKTNDVLFLEDDVLAPSHALSRLMSDLEQKKKAALVSGCVFDRHAADGSAPIIFSWRLLRATAMEKGKIKVHYSMDQVKQPWGLQRVNATGFSCTLIRRSRLPGRMVSGFPFKTKNPNGQMQQFSGCDIVYSLEAQKHGREVYCDFDVRPLHFDSKGRVH